MFPFTVYPIFNFSFWLLSPSGSGLSSLLFDREEEIDRIVGTKSRSADAQFLKHDVVAVPFANKWIRGLVERVLSDRSHSIWAIDYGVPLI